VDGGQYSFTLRYADLHFGSKDPGIAFDDAAGPDEPTANRPS
jgi:hypothetical protein